MTDKEKNNEHTIKLNIKVTLTPKHPFLLQTSCKPACFKALVYICMFCDMQICMFQCLKVPPISMSCDKAVPEPELSFAIVFVHVDAGYQQGRPGHCAVENLKHQKVKIRSESEKVKK